MKKNLLIGASVLVLASCGSNSQNVDLTEQNLDIVSAVESRYDSKTGYQGSENEVLNKETMELREDLVAITDNRVLFNFDSSALSAEAREELKLIAGFLLASDNLGKITVEGHADERGTREYNLSLGERRAVAIKRYLVGLGLDSEHITTISYGKEKPVDTSNTTEAWSKNRRGVILINAAK